MSLRAAAREGHPTRAGPRIGPPIVREVLRSADHPLDGDTQARMGGARFGHDFSRVRVLTACLQRQPAAPAQVPAAGPGASDAVSRAEFDRDMVRRFGVQRIRTGSFGEQEADVNSRPGVQPGGRLTRPRWHEWDPGSASPIYRWIVDAFEDFESRVGGLPPVQEIIFFDTYFTVDTNGNVVPAPKIGADFGAGIMRVYRSGVSTRTPLPFARSDASDRYPGMGVIGVAGIEGQTPGAPLPVPTAAQSAARTITHELGHGLAEEAHKAEPNLFDQYRRDIGWFGDKLFDIGIPAVRTAIAGNTAPPASITVKQGGHTLTQPTEITKADWNHPRWIEQPLTYYMVTGGPGEDFAEAVMAYTQAPDLLRTRSPSRYLFLDSHRERWLPHLYVRPPVGDFPQVSGRTGVG